MQTLLNKLLNGEKLTSGEYLQLLTIDTPEAEQLIISTAQEVALSHFGRRIYLRGLIEISNICRNNCLYCGIRSGNRQLTRYRLSHQEVLACCATGHQMGFRTFVLQGGEDPHWRGRHLVELVSEIRQRYPDSAITLSLGEMSREAYQELYQAGANRYLLRHETYDPTHYTYLHPSSMKWENRIHCIRTLKEIGYQVGTGIMVGSPRQTVESMAQDLLFISELQPAMIGVGPFIPHHDTPFAHEPSGSLRQTIRFIALCRLSCPHANIPASTAVATLHPEGRLQAILAGANVVMPNLSPAQHREQYALYDHKAHTHAEAAEGVALLEQTLQSIGYSINWSRGDFSPNHNTDLV